MNPDTNTRAASAGQAPALSRLLEQTADAVQAVRGGRSLTDVLAACPAPLRPGTQALSFHVLRRLGAAQAVRALVAPRTPPPAVEALLLSALALLWPDDAPQYADHTLVDQAVTAARKRAPQSASFLNAVLRRFLRERDALVAAALKQPTAQWNHPQWWIDRLKADWPTQWQGILAAAQERPPMCLRVNVRQFTGAQYLAQLEAAGLAGRLTDTQTIVLESPVPVDRLPGFADGAVSVQDAAAQRAGNLLVATGLAPGARVLDACAAPGGKTAHLLELADLDVLALDSDPTRLVRVDDALARLRLKARTQAGDGRRPADWWDGRPFDAILLDAPCSASGIVRRHPDIRWLRRSEDIAALGKIQSELLDALWPTLKPGGWLLYATCSVFRTEGEHQIDAFLQRRGASDAHLDGRSPGHLLPLPDNGSTGASSPGSGAAMGSDGFYYALLRKEFAAGGN